MGEAPVSGSDGDAITHGICDDCLNNILFQEGTSMQAFLDSLNAPIMLVRGNGTVQMPNRAAADLLRMPHGSVAGRQPGEIFECQHARFPPGCGKTIHCSGCAIRMAIKKTIETGRSVVHLPATVRQDDCDVRLLISTEKVGPMILLRIDEVNTEKSSKD